MQRLRGGLVRKEAHRLFYHSTLGLRVIKKKEKKVEGVPSKSLFAPCEGAERISSANTSFINLVPIKITTSLL